MTELIWLAVLVQMALGGFDTPYHHELTERLAWRSAQSGELRLHGVRNLAYAILFATLGWSEPHGAAAAAPIAARRDRRSGHAVGGAPRHEAQDHSADLGDQQIWP